MESGPTGSHSRRDPNSGQESDPLSNEGLPPIDPADIGKTEARELLKLGSSPVSIWSNRAAEILQDLGDNPHILAALGACHMASQSVDDARPFFEDALQLDRQHRIAHQGMCRVVLVSAGRAKATEYYQQMQEHGVVPEQRRSLFSIAHEISENWQRVSEPARPYLEALQTLVGFEDLYGADRGEEVTTCFLSNAQGWRGETAQQIKQELNSMLRKYRRGEYE